MLALLVTFALMKESPLADIGPAPDVSLIDSTGRPFQLSSLRGKAAVVSFIYTTCNGTCPATTFELHRTRQALKQAGLWKSKVEFVSITLDPERDTPEALARYAKLYNADPAAWHFLTGSKEQVGRVLKEWDMWVRLGPSGVLDHPSRIFLVDPQGRQREIYNLASLKPETVVQDVKSVLEPAGPP